ncbi:MAG: arsenate reductase ArsC [Gammaproteobacteria bacterium]|nr:MAG: arsenate reductase ArsC [Gammaproteobacteria bacterium]
MKILFICTHNRCRSILSEAITNQMAGDKVSAFSAGSEPAGEVHPLSLKYLQQRGIATGNLSSKSWDEFKTVQPDIVITVCDHAASEPCPVWFGDCIQVHWGLSDPSKLQVSDEQQKKAFFAVMDTIINRTNKLLALDLNLNSMDKSALKNALTTIATEH